MFEQIIVNQSRGIVGICGIISVVKVEGISLGLGSWLSLSRSLAIVVSSNMIGIVVEGSWGIVTIVQPWVSLWLGFRLSESQSKNGKENL